MTDTKKKVLIVDDDEGVRDATACALVSEGFDVITAADGRGGIQKAYKENPDIILLDVRLPDIDGFNVCKEIRNTPKTADIPVIMITGDRAVDIDRSFAAGADDCFYKPLDMPRLLDRIRKLAKRRYRVLVVDDDRQVCDMLASIIKKQNYDVNVLYEGTDLKKTIRDNRPDLILLDVQLPVGPDGIEMCRTIKGDDDMKTIPVVMLTANEYTDAVEKCFSFGAEDYIFKPFNLPDLLLKMKKFLRTTRHA